ncbi:MAG: RcnB family protein [Sphingomonas sp.]|uniref:RcnB family protein n=1 Tax=Sphingomonas sp. TaxID=28214 RepID=UPI001B279C3D|nr:RcnB family protein [Sphingomonas sp.]MBO9623304.1 RcnB family protein [Sphingomonas sp.]
MKKIIMGLVAASIATVPAVASAAPAPQHRGHQVERSYNGHQQFGRQYQSNQYRSWNRGDRFDSRYARNYRQIDYRSYRGLRVPPRGYHYVQSGNDALLVGITSGIVAAVFANILN